MSITRLQLLIRAGRSIAALAVLSLAALPTAACPVKQPETLAHTSTAAERSPTSLPLDVEEYTWSFFNYAKHIRISGRVRNNSAEACQAVSLQVELKDEAGTTVAQGLAYIYPTYLRPGGEGFFEVVDMPKPNHQNLPAGRLVTTAFVQQRRQ